jgi:AcrR family transcriptional regulator
MAARTKGPRERLVRTAGELFYRNGITASGVDTIVAGAGVSKPTLYAQFGSKAALVAAALELRHRQRREDVEAYLRGLDVSPRERLLAAFDWVDGVYRTDTGDRGCPFLNAATELVGPDDEPAREVVRRHKRWWRELLAGLARDAGADHESAARIASQLQLLFEGAHARVLVEGDLDAARAARRAAAVLLAAWLPEASDA